MKTFLIFLTLIFFSGSLFSQDCTNDSFTPIPGKAYVISAWVKDNVGSQPVTYTGSIQLVNTYLEAGSLQTDNTTFSPGGTIIDGWQRIYGIFTVKPNTQSLDIKLVSMQGGTSYFDDIRVYPYNGNLKSFVYDPVTLRLMAELDENNYATFYEYDKEGGLVRVKKETERGTFTIQETRSGNSKLNSN